MSESPTPGQHRTTATVRDRDVAAQIVIDLTERGIDGDRVTTRELAAAQTEATARETGESDADFADSTGKSLGAGWGIGFLIGAVVGVVGVSLLLEPPWTSMRAAGIALAVAIGVGYFAGGMGFLQAGISKANANKAESRTTGGHQHANRPGGGTDAAAPGPRTVEVVVDAASADEAEAARSVFAAHHVETR
jgi:hypothetical protein